MRRRLCPELRADRAGLGSWQFSTWMQVTWGLRCQRPAHTATLLPTVLVPNQGQRDLLSSPPGVVFSLPRARETERSRPERV